jgi:hypothetical protein
MNSQPSETISSITALLFTCLFFYFLFTRKSQSNNDGFFRIGYIETMPPCQNTVIVNNDKHTNVNESLLTDCIDALVALGFKKRSAKKLAEEIFRKHNPSNIQQFLTLAINNK